MGYYRALPLDLRARLRPLPGGLKEKQLLGFECPRCQEVYCPPQDICPRCGGDFDPEQCRPLGEEGDLVSFTVVEANLFGPRPDDEYLRRRIHPADLGEHPLLWPPDPPYAIVMVRLDGAANNFLHLARGRISRVSRWAAGCGPCGKKSGKASFWTWTALQCYKGVSKWRLSKM